jgi:hypothetical protein
MSPFATSVNKDVIRQQLDSALLASFRAEVGHRLTYFGLPGPSIHDLIDWSGVLARTRTGVEAWGRSASERRAAEATVSRLNTMVQVRGLGNGFSLLLGDIEDVILQERDANGQPIPLPAYDLVNLDFDGGFGFVVGGDAKRPRAVRQLVRRQRGHPFVFLITVNVRDTLGSAIDDYLLGLEERAADGQEAERLAWFRSRSEGQRVLKLAPVICHYVREAGEAEAFAVRCFPPVTYIGHERARMLHFMFVLRPTAGVLRAFSPQSLAEVLCLPVLVVDEGRLGVASKGCSTDAAELLEFLPSEMREGLKADERQVED